VGIVRPYIPTIAFERYGGLRAGDWLDVKENDRDVSLLLSHIDGYIFIAMVELVDGKWVPHVWKGLMREIPTAPQITKEEAQAVATVMARIMYSPGQQS
jgi:hypothetical protein